LGKIDNFTTEDRGKLERGRYGKFLSTDFADFNGLRNE
jgi:hypothetical protein